MSADARPVALEAAGTRLSALLSEPPGSRPPLATVVALHGGGMTASYFDARSRPGLSLLELGATLGFSVLAVDRPGYGRSARELPQGVSLSRQTRLLRAGLADFAGRHPTGAGVFLLAHSYGGKLALSLAAAADAGDRLLGVDVSGCGHRYEALPAAPGAAGPSRRDTLRHWGPLRLYPPGTFRAGRGMTAPMPGREAAGLARWPRVFARLAPWVRVPVRLTFAEHERWWRHGEPDLADLAGRFTASPRVQVDRQPGAGHNISLGWAARAYHLRALAFFTECLARAD